MLSKPRYFFLFLLVSFVPVAFSESASRPLILVHFMPWYQTPSVHRYWGWHWTMNHFNPETMDAAGHRSIASHYYPLTGPYDSQDSIILEYQTLLMRISGIDGVLVDWYGMDSFFDYGVLNESTKALFPALQRAHLSFGIVYEDQTIKHMIDNGYLNAGSALEKGKAVMQYLQTWFATDTYVKIDGRPVLLNFGPQYFFASSDWDTLFSGLPVTPLFFTLDNCLSPAAVGAFPWPPMSWTNTSGILTESALNDYLTQFYQQATGWPYLVTSAFPGFYDIYAQAGVGSSYGYLDAQNGATFTSTLRQALNHHPNIIQVVTWNDYGEGTIVEPTVEFGYQYLALLLTTRRSLDSAFPFQQDDLNLPLRIYNARRQHANDEAINLSLDRVRDLIVAGQPADAKSVLDSLLMYVSPGVGGIPTVYSLEQNYPNPFNPSTVIQYSIAKQGPVTLKVYTMLGQEVETLFNGMQSAGVYSVSFDASRLPSGVYFYSLRAGNFFTVKKLLLLQ